MNEVVSNSVLPAIREAITLHTSDGLKLVGELAMPVGGSPEAVIICLHPNPTGGGMMDSHLYRKAAWRLPALSNVAILRFNTRGTSSAAGTSEGTYDEARSEKFDLEAALAFVAERGLTNVWLAGWSFGTSVVINHGNVDPVQGAILFSPPLKWTSDEALSRWAETGRPMLALVPELDEYLAPDDAYQRFAIVPQAEVVGIDGCKHLWVGEKYVRIAWERALGFIFPNRPAPHWMWDGPMGKWDDLKQEEITIKA